MGGIALKLSFQALQDRGLLQYAIESLGSLIEQKCRGLRGLVLISQEF